MGDRRWLVLQARKEHFSYEAITPDQADAKSLPATDPDPVSTLMTPGGIPALWDNSANLRAVRGHTAAGLMTTVLPAAKQAAIFQESIIKG